MATQLPTPSTAHLRTRHSTPIPKTTQHVRKQRHSSSPHPLRHAPQPAPGPTHTCCAVTNTNQGRLMLAGQSNSNSKTAAYLPKHGCCRTTTYIRPDDVDPAHRSTTHNHAHADQKHTQACKTPKRATCFPAASLRVMLQAAVKTPPSHTMLHAAETTHRACGRQKHTLSQLKGSDKHHNQTNTTAPRHNNSNSCSLHYLSQRASIATTTAVANSPPCKQPDHRQFITACISAASCCFSWCAEIIPCFTAAP